MKSIAVSLLLCVVTSSADSTVWTNEDRRIEAEQIALWKDNLNSSKLKTSAERLDLLSLGLKNLGYRTGVVDHSPETEEIYGKIQNAMLSLPGHAQYFADKIIKEQKEVEPYPTNVGPRLTYDSNRTKIFETLQHLPSPETIKVLGDFLSDDKDAPVPLISADSDWGENSRANSYGASATIMRIGLRNPPVVVERRNENQEQLLADTRAWWEDIKSGKHAFSFRGQSVEYRFKPDGNWETIALASPPDDMPRASKSKNAAHHGIEKRIPLPLTKPWVWLACAVSATIGIFWMRRIFLLRNSLGRRNEPLPTRTTDTTTKGKVRPSSNLSRAMRCPQKPALFLQPATGREIPLPPANDADDRPRVLPHHDQRTRPPR